MHTIHALDSVKGSARPSVTLSELVLTWVVGPRSRVAPAFHPGVAEYLQYMATEYRWSPLEEKAPYIHLYRAC